MEGGKEDNNARQITFSFLRFRFYFIAFNFR
jgi:hypothetical protein